MSTVTLVLALHNHQPVGNFDHVVADAVEAAYLPFLETMEAYPDLPYCLHVSGCLLEWAEKHAPAYVDALKAAVTSGRVELLGGGRFEPIFPALAERDRLGQIQSFSDHLGALFGVHPRGGWLPERVYEQSLVSSLSKAGLSYTVVDDFHLKRAGVRDLAHHFITEDEGRQLHLFPSSEALRYAIPFSEPATVIDLLRRTAEETEDALLVYADDGEKFGVWPGTHKHVYEDGWLRRFLDLVAENRDWIRLTTFSGVLDGPAAPRLVFVPDSSYREMVEWALPGPALAEFRGLEAELEGAGLLQRLRPFLGGGFWRNFRVKYSEANRLYSRMMEVSTEVSRMDRDAPGREEALLDLYRGQVNCVYWHGVFGGLYLPHLRLAAYRHLLRAENAARAAEPDAPGTVSTRVFDFDFDGRTEVTVNNGLLKAYVAPHRGGHLFELDVLAKEFNPLMTMTRRLEDYHADISDEDAPDEVETIHHIRRSKTAGIKSRLAYDRHERASLVDHFLGPAVDLEGLGRGAFDEAGDFVDAPYRLEMAGGGPRTECNLFRQGRVKVDGEPAGLSLVKKLVLAAGDRHLTVHYALLAERSGSVRFAPEFNFAMLAGDTPDRYYFDRKGDRVGPTGFTGVVDGATYLGLVDEWMGLSILLTTSEPAAFHLYPVETVSQSEAGFELLYQQSCVTPVFDLALEQGVMRELELTLAFEYEGGFPGG